MFDLTALREAADFVHQHVPPTPQLAWPLLAERTGCQVWVKHENHAPTGAFKVRGGLVYVRSLLDSGEVPAGLVTATRGNHGQSMALAARQAGLPLVIVVPEGNSLEKNAAMRALGAELIEHGVDFDVAREHAAQLAQGRGYLMVPSFHAQLVRGVATYALELFEAVTGLDTVYVPIGMGSGICGLIQARNLLGLRTEIVGVVSSAADAYARSFESGRIVTTASANTFADGMACRVPKPRGLRPGARARGADRAGERRRDRPGHAPVPRNHPQHRRRRRCCGVGGAAAGARTPGRQACGSGIERRESGPGRLSPQLATKFGGDTSSTVCCLRGARISASPETTSSSFWL